MTKLRSKYISLIVLLNLIVFYFLWSFQNFFSYLSFIIFLPFLFLKRINIRHIIFFLLFVFLFFLHFFFLSPQLFINQEKILKIFFFLTIFLFVLLFKEYILIEIKKLYYIFLGLLIVSILINLFKFYNNDLPFFSLLSGRACTFNSFVTRDSFFFKENSHIGIVLSSLYLCILYKISITKKFVKIFFLCIGLILIFLNSSTTFYFALFISCLFVFFTNFKIVASRFKYYLTFSCIFTLFVLVFEPSCSQRFKHLIPTFILTKSSLKSVHISEIDKKKSDNKNLYSDLNNKTQHSDLNNKTQHSDLNLTTQVYVKSIIITFKSFIDYPLGSGFDSFSIIHQNYENDFELLNPDVQRYNKEDASSMFLKLIAEYGIFSIFLFYLIYKFATSKIIDLYIKLFFLPMIVSNFIRGTGYFKGGFLISVFIIFILVYEKKINSIIGRFIK
jgi:hypothetical protein